MNIPAGNDFTTPIVALPDNLKTGLSAEEMIALVIHYNYLGSWAVREIPNPEFDSGAPASNTNPETIPAGPALMIPAGFRRDPEQMLGQAGVHHLVTGEPGVGNLMMNYLGGTTNDTKANDWAITVSKEPDTGQSDVSMDPCITVYSVGGQESNPKYNLDYPDIIVRVRGPRTPESYRNCAQRLSFLQALLIGMDSYVAPDKGLYLGSRLIGHAGFIDYDTHERPMFSMFLRLYVEPNNIGSRIRLASGVTGA